MSIHRIELDLYLKEHMCYIHQNLITNVRGGVVSIGENFRKKEHLFL